ncbi:MAG: hypothetical protein EP341_03150 [Sphingomonadales bacterium]|nr:MAG: hypothetical protein EP341_03150 [Sphingomonadales bacterium]
MPAGRPTKYKPEYCQLVIDMGREGKSWAQMASALDVDRATFYNWQEQHPEFFTAFNRAKAHAQAWWEDKAAEALNNREFNAPVWKKSVEARFREDYTERREDTTTHKVDDSVSALMDAVNGRTRSK